MSSKRNRDKSVEMSLMNPRDQWKNIFDKYDRNRDGHIYIKDLDDVIENAEYEHDLPDHVVAKLHDLADISNDGQFDAAKINHPAVEPLIKRYVHMLVPIPTKPPKYEDEATKPPKYEAEATKSPKYEDEATTTKLPKYEVKATTTKLPKYEDEATKPPKYEDEATTTKPPKYEDAVTCCPPPISMIIISIIQIIFYCVDTANTDPGLGPIATAFIYDPRRRYEAWRYISYMFVHIGVIHLVVNLCVQVLLGTPLEIVHRWWRVLVIYFAGVIAGSLATSIIDPRVKLAGSSGGVYAFITAHIATIVINWREMEFPFIQLAIYLIITGCDIGTAIYDRYVQDVNKQIGYGVHFAGAAAGLLVGLNVLRNFNITRKDRVIGWMSIITYIVLIGIAIVWNAAYTDYFPPQ